MKAFPTNIDVATGGDSWRTEHGMDLRDYFASDAMNGLIGKQLMIGYDEAVIAKDAYKMADAMMEVRKK